MKFTLLSDGSSDAALIPLLTWLLRENGVSEAILAEWADLRLVRWQYPPTLADKIMRAIDLYPCDLLFIHRDAEREPLSVRVEEIVGAVEQCAKIPVHVCVVPIRMLEAWLLFDESAIRYAAGNRNGTVPLAIPAMNRLEKLPDPKEELYSLMRTASGLHGRRLKKLPVSRYIHRISDVIDDFSPLRKLTAFSALEAELRDKL